MFWEKAAQYLIECFGDICITENVQFYKILLIGVRYLNVANGRKSLLDLFPDVHTIVDSEVSEANI